MLPPVAPVVVIHDDGGGMVAEFARRVADYRRHHVVVRVLGTCASACTMVLALRDRVCVGPDAQFGFHQAFNTYADRAHDPTDRSEPGTDELLRHYPAPVRWWIDAHGGLGPDLIWLRGEELRAVVPACHRPPHAEGGRDR